MGALRHQLRGTCGGAWIICVCNLRPRFFPQCGAPLTNRARHAQWHCIFGLRAMPRQRPLRMAPVLCVARSLCTFRLDEQPLLQKRCW